MRCREAKANLPAREGSRLGSTVFAKAFKSSTTLSNRAEFELLDPASASRDRERTVVREKSSSGLTEVEGVEGRMWVERLAMH